LRTRLPTVSAVGKYRLPKSYVRIRIDRFNYRVNSASSPPYEARLNTRRNRRTASDLPSKCSILVDRIPNVQETESDRSARRYRSRYFF
jgi:hypothetical protein